MVSGTRYIKSLLTHTDTCRYWIHTIEINVIMLNCCHDDTDEKLKWRLGKTLAPEAFCSSIANYIMLAFKSKPLMWCSLNVSQKISSVAWNYSHLLLARKSQLIHLLMGKEFQGVELQIRSTTERCKYTCMGLLVLRPHNGVRKLGDSDWLKMIRATNCFVPNFRQNEPVCWTLNPWFLLKVNIKIHIYKM